MTNNRLLSIERILIITCFIATPLLITPFTSELFEFPKNIFIQALSIFIGTIFVYRHLEKDKKWKIKFSSWDILVGLFLCSLALSGIFSIDRRVSWTGYYTRFFGGIGSYISIFVILFALKNQIKEDKTMVLTITRCIVVSGVSSSLWAILQHFGVDASLWVQNSRERVFSTLGQPNWLAAYLAAALPLNISLLVKEEKGKFLLAISAVIMGAALWFTSSLSGLAAVTCATLIWAILSRKADIVRNAGWLTVVFLLLGLVVFFQPGLMGKRVIRVINEVIKVHAQENSVLEQPGGDSWEIRNYLWKGTWRLITSQPKNFLIGSGPATFAYAFLPFRPDELNKSTEWDFLYNKAHNEILNIWTEQGLFGVLVFAATAIYTITLIKKIPKEKRTFAAGLLSGWLGLNITNLTGFSVSVTALIFWTLPLLMEQLKEKQL